MHISLLGFIPISLMAIFMFYLILFEMKKFVLWPVMALACLFCGCSNVSKNNVKPYDVSVQKLQFKSDSLVIYFEKSYRPDSSAFEIRTVPISNIRALCAYGIVAEENDLIQQYIDAQADRLKMTFRVELIYHYIDADLTETTKLRFDIAR